MWFFVTKEFEVLVLVVGGSVSQEESRGTCLIPVSFDRIYLLSVKSIFEGIG